MIIKPPNVYIKHTGTPKGKGVFAGSDFAAGKVVEVCPVLLYHIPAEDIQEEEIRRRVFHWHPPRGKSRVQALALGYGSMYNHDTTRPTCATTRISQTSFSYSLPSERPMPMKS